VDGLLTDRRVLVTGAATGIGAVAATVLSKAGAKVAATFHNTPPPAADAPVDWLHCDVTQEESVNSTVREAVTRLGGLDVLVHAAGLWAPGVPGQVDTNNLQKMIDINFKSTVLTNQAAYSVMRESGGHIINFGSSEAVTGNTRSATYAASKAAVHTWTRSAAKAWGSDRVRVNALLPAVQTPGADRLKEFLGDDGMEELERQLQVAIPLGGKLGDPATDLGPVLVFLASEGSGFITGQLLAVNGGLLMLGA
jgi:3-oxoacyl-[acyl-carrier protein] reductase